MLSKLIGGGAVAKMVKALVKTDLTWIGGAWIDAQQRQQKEKQLRRRNTNCQKGGAGLAVQPSR